jgi:lysophospholipase L1-like esterase
MQQIASEMGTGWVDLRGVAEPCPEDGVHFGVDQHAAVAQAVFAAVSPLLPTF